MSVWDSHVDRWCIFVLWSSDSSFSPCCWRRTWWPPWRAVACVCMKIDVTSIDNAWYVPLQNVTVEVHSIKHLTHIGHSWHVHIYPERPTHAEASYLSRHTYAILTLCLRDGDGYAIAAFIPLGRRWNDSAFDRFRGNSVVRHRDVTKNQVRVKIFFCKSRGRHAYISPDYDTGKRTF